MTTDIQPTDLPYVYFVSYSHAGLHGHGFGNTEIKTNSPISAFEQVTEIGKLIARKGGMPDSAVVVIDYQLLRGPEVASGDAP